jgi:hypothetical protein
MVEKKRMIERKTNAKMFILARIFRVMLLQLIDSMFFSFSLSSNKNKKQFLEP